MKDQKEAFENEKEELKRVSTFEAKRFGDFIQRLETRKQELKKENEILTKQNSELKNSNRKLEQENKDCKLKTSTLRTFLKRRETEIKKLDEEEPTSKIKSVVTKPNQPESKRRLDFGHFHKY